MSPDEIRKRLGLPAGLEIIHDRAKTIAAHLAIGSEARRDLRRGRGVHVFLPTIDLAKLEDAVWKEGIDQGEIDGYRRIALGRAEPIGVRKQRGRPDMPLRVVEVKGTLRGESWLYHLVPRSRPKR